MSRGRIVDYRMNPNPQTLQDLKDVGNIHGRNLRQELLLHGVPLADVQRIATNVANFTKYFADHYSRLLQEGKIAEEDKIRPE